MKKSVHPVAIAFVFCGLMTLTANGQWRSPDPYQRNARPQSGQPDRQGMDQPPRPSRGQRQGQDGSQQRLDGMRGPQRNRQRGGPQGRDRGMQQGRQQGGGQPGFGAGQGRGVSRNPVILALDTNRDGELSAEEIANASESLKTLDKNGDGKLSRDEMRPADGGRQDAGPRRASASQRRLPQDSRPPSSRQGVPRTDAVGRASSLPSARDSQAGSLRHDSQAGSLRHGATTPAPAEGFALIPAGQFEMGDHHGLGGREHRNDEVPVHLVSVSAFYMQRTETTNEQYCEFLNDAWRAETIELRDGKVVQAGSDIVYCDTYASDKASQIVFDAKNDRFVVRPGKSPHPVVCIRWHGAAAYCNWLSTKEGYAPCYDTRTWTCDFTKDGYRLPTEAEWEYAARGGLTNPYRIFPWGDEPDTRRANWPNSGDPYETGPYPWTTPVAFYNGTIRTKEEFNWPGPQKTYQTHDGANGYGLYDMSGNVWEWTNDWYSPDYYAFSPVDNPTGPARGKPLPDGKPYHVLRGGSWYNGQWGHGRVSNRNPAYYRGPNDPNHSYYHIGFRPVRPAKANAAASGAPRVAVRPPQPRRPDPVLRPSLLESSGIDLGLSVPGKTRVDGRRLGLIINDSQAFKGYTLFAPKHNTMVYLIDNEGRVVHRWDTEYEPGQSVYLLPNGHLLHCCFTKNRNFTRGGEGGRLEEYDWQGNLVWEFEYSTDKVLSHHDIAPLPNGNVLLLAVEYKSREECIEAGFDPRLLRDGKILSEHIIEVKKTGPKSGEIVWEWHAWDHLIQDFDPTKANYGNVSEHPERIDVHGSLRLRGSRGGIPAFWLHANSIDYNPELDQILLSVRGFNEIWVIDHSTTTEEAAGPAGDLLWRWGNPIAYKNGRPEDRKLFQQHDAQWIPKGCPGAGNILIFNNGLDRGFSSVIEIKPPVDKHGRYTSYDAPIVWEYRADPPEAFYSPEISGAQRLPNGNTLICAGCLGDFFEVTPAGEIVWRYVNPVVREGILPADGEPGTDHRGHQWNAVFKIHRYAPDYPAFAGKSLTPDGVIEQPIGAPMLQTGGERKFGPESDRGPGPGRGQGNRRRRPGAGGPRPGQRPPR